VHMHTLSALPTFLAAPSKFSFPGLYAICFLKKFPDMGRTYPSSLCLKKHVRIIMWGAPMFLIFWMGEPIGWYKHAPKRCFLSFWKGWGFDFPSSSQKVPINIPSKFFCSHQVPKKSPRIPLVPIN
jgi:hypothetical protein